MCGNGQRAHFLGSSSDEGGRQQACHRQWEWGYCPGGRRGREHMEGDGGGGGPSVQEDVAGAEALRKGQETIGEGTRGALYVKSGQHTRVGLTGTA